ncbi:phage antirepressor [Rhodococcus erythropolis]|uniref:phage antirepressor n=1 Tax=Rhodococcus erythropolis TaxID=1833 RepID=UPI000698DB23|nr:phage antirepressor KilAC domain-containing protein [Rhodococcus erythropolis]
MSALFTYENNEIRTVDIESKRWAVAADICRVLGLTQPDKAILRLDEADRISTTVRSGGQNRKMWVVSEDGATDLVLDSRKPEARKFRRFLTHEVWPSIRKTGSYGTPTLPDFTALDPNSLAFIEQLGKGMQLAIESAKKNQSKADAFDTFLNGKGCYLIDTVANLIGAKHKALWSFLFSEKILIEKGPRRREPYAKAKFDGWFSVKTHDQEKTNGHASRTTYVTPLGMEGIRLLAIDRGLIEPQLMILPSSPIRELSS